MEELKRLQADNVPVLKSVWLHNNDVVGIDKNGDPVILARLEGNEGAHGIEKKRPRAPRPRPEKKDSSPVNEPE